MIKAYRALSKILNRSKTFIIFCLVGVVSAVVDLSVLYILNNIIVETLIISVTLAFIAGLAANYILHTNITFRSKASTTNATKFLFVVAFNYLLTLAVIKFGVDFASFGVIVSKIISLPIVAISGFILSKYWVYK
ncbi:GtrA family protein [Aeromonas veronii]|uniref:GtrA family protein n=1 Tax=Aeromonas veronii TaxID=654 RepID=UPI001F213D55|nr:GtrA family protein [Aeromonas veronii]MCF5869638.1 GtrA family protein [Aeromonas veronii]